MVFTRIRCGVETPTEEKLAHNRAVCLTCERSRGRARYHKDVDASKARSRAYYARNPSTRREANARWRKANPVEFKKMLLEKSAKKRQLEFSLSLEELAALMAATNCELCKKTFGAARRDRPSVDRLDNEKGYISGNCATLCCGCNSKKNSMSLLELQRMVSWLRDRLQRPA